MKILAVNFEEGTGGTQSDGILGLVRAANDGADLLLDILAVNKLIDSRSFGMNLVKEDSLGQSKIIFGDYDHEIVKDSDDLNFVDLIADVDWRVKLKKILYDDKIINTKGGIAVFDSGTSLTLLETPIYYRILGELIFNKDCFTVTDEFEQKWDACFCDTKYDFGDIKFHFGDYIFDFDPEFYIQTEIVQGSNACVFKLVKFNSGSSEDVILLGDNFLHNFYIYHDAEKKQIALVGPHDKVDSALGNFASKSIAYLTGITLVLSVLFS